MAFGKLRDRARFALHRLGEKLWIKPLLASVLSVAVVFAAKAADGTSLAEIVPSVTVESIQTLLSIMASSVLVIASKNEYFGPAGRFVLFFMTLVVLAVVVLTFVTWIDRIARLGRVGVTIKQVEHAAGRSMRARRETPFLGGHAQRTPAKHGIPLYAAQVGFLQHIDMSGLHEVAEELELRLEIAALPGTFMTPDRVIAYCVSAAQPDAGKLYKVISDNFIIGRDRTFEDDPRFGLVVLAQIAGKALSPAINDPGTAIDVIGVFVRLFVDWNKPRDADTDRRITCDRISVPPLREDDMFDDAFTAIARDGANAIEVTLRLLKALDTLARVGDEPMRSAAVRHAKRVLALAERQAHLPDDRALMAQHAPVT